MKRVFLVTSILAFFLLSCQTQGDSNRGQQKDQNGFINPSEMPWLMAGNRVIVNDKNQEILLKGLNVNNGIWGHWVDGVSEKLEQEGRDPLIRPERFSHWALEEKDFNQLASLGLNAVRYQFSYDQFALDNPYKDENLLKLMGDIEDFNRRGIYVIVALQTPPGLDVQNQPYEDKFPASERIESIIESDIYFNQLVEMWTFLAVHLKNIPGVAGYELTNEPRVPCNAEGGIELFKSRLISLSQEIRKIDKRHILFIPEYNSREVDQGDIYWDNQLEDYREDQGEQGISWDKGFVNISPEISNIVYVLHPYETYEITHLGTHFNEHEEIRNAIAERVYWRDQNNNAPLMATEFGINRYQDVELRSDWTEYILALLDSHGISSTYYTYKNVLSVYNQSFDYFGVYGEYPHWDKEILVGNESWGYLNTDIQNTAMDSEMDEIIRNFLWQEDELKTFTELDNQPLIEVLKEHFQRGINHHQ